MLLGGCKDEYGMCRRFLESLEESIEGCRRKHVYLIDDVDAVLPHLRRNLNLLHQVADVIDTVVGSGIQLVDAVGTSLAERKAGFAFPARIHLRGRIRAVDGFGEDSRGCGLSHSPGTAEKIGMRQFPPDDGVLQGLRNVVLPDECLERVRTVFPG